MDAQTIGANGQEMVHSETYRLGRGLGGFMDVDRVGIWDIVRTPVCIVDQFQRQVMYKR
jgi:hypothetical protein